MRVSRFAFVGLLAGTVVVVSCILQKNGLPCTADTDCGPNFTCKGDGTCQSSHGDGGSGGAGGSTSSSSGSTGGGKTSSSSGSTGGGGAGGSTSSSSGSTGGGGASSSSSSSSSSSGAGGSDAGPPCDATTGVIVFVPANNGCYGWGVYTQGDPAFTSADDPSVNCLQTKVCIPVVSQNHVVMWMSPEDNTVTIETTKSVTNVQYRCMSNNKAVPPTSTQMFNLVSQGGWSSAVITPLGANMYKLSSPCGQSSSESAEYNYLVP